MLAGFWQQTPLQSALQRKLQLVKNKLRNDNTLVKMLNKKGFDIRRMWCRTTCSASMKACEKSNVEWGAGRILKR
jgi:hypothetical protein